MKKIILNLFSTILVVAVLVGCVNTGKISSDENTNAVMSSEESDSNAISFVDALGYEVNVESWNRVVSLYGSFAEMWVLAGGDLVGTTSHAIEERGLTLGESVAIIGSVKQPSMEELLATNPDFVILSAEVSEHTAFHQALVDAEIPHAYYSVSTFEDYLMMLSQFCEMTGRKDLYEEYGVKVQTQIEEVLAAVENQESSTALLIRAFSTGAKAKGDDNLAGVVLRDLGAENLVSKYESLLEDVSMEEIIVADPDYIFVVTMGSSEQQALDYLATTFEENPAWSSLSAVQNDRYIILPRELFHYKPNARWGESYAYLAKILYPQITDELQ